MKMYVGTTIMIFLYEMHEFNNYKQYLIFMLTNY